MAHTPTGSVFSVSSGAGTLKTITGISNASEAVVTSVAHGYTDGDFVKLDVTWGRLSNRAFKVNSIDTDTFGLVGMDTTDTDLFPTGTCTGKSEKLAAFTALSKLLSPSVSGGDAKTATFKYLESEDEAQIPDGRAPVQYTVDIDADAIGNAGYTAVKALSDSGDDAVLRVTLKGGSYTLLVCRVDLNENPMLSEGQVNKVKATFSGLGRVVRYAA
jgi:hypothetical protein